MSLGTQDGKSRRGFASMTPEKRREIARLGGKAAHEKGRAHQFTPNEAREAGRKGGLSVSKNRQHMAEIGRAGGKARGGARPVAYGASATPPATANEQEATSSTGELFHFPEQALQQYFAGMNFPASKAQILERVDDGAIHVGQQDLPIRDLLEETPQDLFASVAQIGEAIDRAVRDHRAA